MRLYDDDTGEFVRFATPDEAKVIEWRNNEGRESYSEIRFPDTASNRMLTPCRK